MPPEFRQTAWIASDHPPRVQIGTGHRRKDRRDESHREQENQSNREKDAGDRDHEPTEGFHRWSSDRLRSVRTMSHHRHHRSRLQT
jgi:hypothetical protein